MNKKFIQLAALFAALAVGMGAFAAHQLKNIFDLSLLQVFETAVKYQFYHALALLVTGILYQQFPNKFLQWAGNLFITGILLFSGSLYLLCFIKYQHISANWVGAITPIGGLCFIAGWVLMALSVSKKL